MSRTWTGWVVAAIAVAVIVALIAISPGNVGADEADDGFDGYIQSGTCAAPTDDLQVKLESDGDHDIEPYVAKTGTDDETVVLGYYGAPGAPGFGVSAIYSDQRFSLVVIESDNGDPVACGDILEPVRDRFGEAGLAVVQLLPVEDSGVQGVATVERTLLQREHDTTPTRVRVLLSTNGDVTTSPPVSGYDGFVQDGTCETAGNRVRVELKGRGDHDVMPFLAHHDGGDDPVTVAYYGAPSAPGFGFATTYADQTFSLVITDTEGTDPIACGDILEPDDDEFAEAGLALVELLPVGDDGAQGFALIDRSALQRELVVTPTRVRIVLFAPPITANS
jgi:hypothetical protein